MKQKEESEKSWLQTQYSKNEDLGIWSHHFMANRWGNNGNTDRLYFLGLQKHLDSDCSHEIKRCLLLGRKAMTNLDRVFKSRDITLPTNVCIVKAMVFPIVMYVCDSYTIKKTEHEKHWCFWTVVLEKTLESPLGCKEIQPVHPKGDKSWMFISRTDDETGAPILWPPDVKSWLIRKHPDAGKDWRQEEKGMTEYAKVGWHLWFKGHEFEQAQGDAEGQGSPACCSPWGHKESNTTELLNNNKKLSKIPPWWLSVKESACNAGDLDFIPGLGRFPGEGKGYPLQYSGLENSMDCIVHGVAKSRTWLNDFHFTSHTP